MDTTQQQEQPQQSSTRAVQPKVRVIRTRVLPVGALDLNEDIMRLEEVCRLLANINPRNCSEDKKTGIDALRMMKSLARLSRLYAQRKMRKEFLYKY